MASSTTFEPSSDDSSIVEELPRKRKGRFNSTRTSTAAKRRKAEQKRTYVARGEVIGRKVFDMFVKLFFLIRTSRDWIRTSQNSGPLVTLFQRLVRPTYLISQEERSKKVTVAFFRGNPKDVEKITTRICTRDENAVTGDPSRIFVYKKRRLPLMAHQSAEIEPVRERIQEVFELGYLKVKTSEEAFSICLDTIKSYVMVNEKFAYRGYPNLRCPPNPPTPATGTNESVDINRAPEITSSDPENQSVETESLAAEELNDTSSLQISSRSHVLNREHNKALDIAHDAAAFVTLSALFDDSIKDYLECCGGYFLERDRSTNKFRHLNDVTKDVLLYAHWRCFGVKDLEEHQKREEGLRGILRVAKGAREAYGLVPYEGLRPKYLS